MDFDINSFANRIIDLFTSSKQMPDMGGDYLDRFGRIQSDESKHKNRPMPRDLRSQIKNSLIETKMNVDNVATMDIGTENMETSFPYYHILQQAPRIKKGNKGTKKTKGSQASVFPVGKRDYEKVNLNFNGKTFTKEYSRNVRGKRMNLDKVSYWSGMKTSSGDFRNQAQNQYLNIHYQYIDKICDEIAPLLANEFGMKLARKQDSGLGDEYFSESFDSTLDSSYGGLDIIGVFDSFE